MSDTDEFIHFPALHVTVHGDTHEACMTVARREAEKFLGDRPYHVKSFSAEAMMAMDGHALTWEASVTFSYG